VVRCEDAYLYCHVVDDAAVHVRTSRHARGARRRRGRSRCGARRPHLRTLWAPGAAPARRPLVDLRRRGRRRQRPAPHARAVGRRADRAVRPRGARSPPRTTTGPSTARCSSTSGARYFVWSGWEHRHRTEEQRLYIARMSSPTTLVGPRVCIAVASEPWEVVGMPVDRGAGRRAAQRPDVAAVRRLPRRHRRLLPGIARPRRRRPARPGGVAQAGPPGARELTRRVRPGARQRRARTATKEAGSSTTRTASGLRLGPSGAHGPLHVGPGRRDGRHAGRGRRPEQRTPPAAAVRAAA
jgi:hypothetical protein